jgi:mRNA degradation ribonuclease J1/J2
MKLKIIHVDKKIGRDLLEIQTEEAKIVVTFGEDIGTGDIPEKVNPVIDGLTTKEAEYDGIFVVRNPENSFVMTTTFDSIPVYLERKQSKIYKMCSDFSEKKVRENILEINENSIVRLKDLQVTVVALDSANFNTYVWKFEDKNGKSVVVTGDFRDYSANNSKDKEKIELIFKILKSADYLIVEGKYLGLYGLEYSSGKEIFDKLKNIMKFYKQVFVIQSQTDITMASYIYEATVKTKKIFIEDALLCNISTALQGTAPNPITSKKVYTYSKLSLENESFEFKKKYVSPFYINNAMQKMKKENYVMNITDDMIQDIQVFFKEGSIYDACIIFAEWKGYNKNKDMEEFIVNLKNFDMDYYELYTHGSVNYELLRKLIIRLEPKNVIPLDFDKNENSGRDLYNFKVLEENEEIEF